MDSSVYLRVTEMAHVELRNITARYGDFIAVHDVSLTIKSGQFVTLLGPSGCGKSSSLRIVAGLLKPNAGCIEFDGRDVTDLDPSKRNIGMVFQSLALFPHMTVRDNVSFGLKMKKVDAAVASERVRRMLEIVRLDHLADRFPVQLSGGQQQRVALARALAITPSILILDEPFGALDRKLRETMQVELHALTRELGITALFVTHDQEEALMLSDLIAVMNKGCIEQLGTPEEIYNAPRTEFVADFMGVTNFLPGRVMSGSQTTKIQSSSVVLDGPVGCGFQAGDLVKLAIRPEKIIMTTQPPASTFETSSAVRGTVQIVTYHGNESRYVLALDAGESSSCY